MIDTVPKKILPRFVNLIEIEQEAVGAYIWAWLYYSYDILYIGYCS